MQGERIAAMGRSDTLPIPTGATVLHLPGSLVCPGFHDSHAHLVHAGRAARELPLAGLGPRQIAESVRRNLRPGGSWLVGRGVAPQAFRKCTESPRALLDAAAPGMAVLLRAHDHHSAYLSSEALQRTGFLAGAPPGVGPELVVRDADGHPTGLLLEDAAWIAEKRAGRMDADEAAADVEALWPELHRHGITALHDMSGTRDHDVLRRLDDEGRLAVEVLATVYVDDAGNREVCRRGRRMRVVGVKAFLDGALGSRTAWLLEPYENDPAHRGIQTLPAAAAREVAQRAAAHGLPSFLHAIGDAAVRSALDAVRGVLRENGAPLRHRVEHAQMVHDDDIPRFAEQGVVASVQPIHMAEDAPLVHAHWGSRSREAFPLRRLLDSGAVVAFGSDGPIETFDVLAGIAAAVERSGRDGTLLHPEEAVTVQEALAAYTAGAAYAAGVEDEMGAVTPGRLANLTVLDRDIVSDPAALRDCRVAATVVRGDVVYAGGAA